MGFLLAPVLIVEHLGRAVVCFFMGKSTILFCATLVHDREGFSGKICTGSAEPATGSAMESHVIAAHNPAFRLGLLENHAGSAEPVAGS